MSECGTELIFNSYCEGERCSTVKIEGVLAKRRIALQLILYDLTDCYSALQLAQVNDRTSMLSILYKSFIITYGKCFSVGTKRGYSLQAQDIFKTNRDYLNLHNQLIKTRNKYVAHSDSEVFEFGEVHLVSNGVEKDITVLIYKFEASIGKSINKKLKLVLYVQEKVKELIEKLEIKMLTEYIQ